MIDLEDMLLEIFEELRQQRVPLGISDYMLAIKIDVWTKFVWIGLRSRFIAIF